MTATSAPSAAVTSFVVASRYMPVYVALGVLVVIAAIWVPQVLGGPSLNAIAPFGALLAIASLGQMLVVMTGGIDLSVPGTISLAAVIMVGVGQRSDDQVGVAILTALGFAALVGLVNGILIAGLKLNALIVTLAIGQVVMGRVTAYGRGFPVQSPVPDAWSGLVSTKVLGVSPILWVGLVLTVLFVIAFRYSTAGRRFQVVGANPVASNVVGVRVNLSQIMAYVIAAILYGITGLLLAGHQSIPGVAAGSGYLLAPIAAVVIGGASLTGGLASPVSTLVAAFFLTGLSQLMSSVGLATDLQRVVFGLVIIGGMLISGDRIIKGVERVLRERRSSKRIERRAKETA